MSELLGMKVDIMFRECLADGEPDAIEIEGIVHTIALSKASVESHREEIRSFVEQLPNEFHKDGGGGWSFLNLCNRADGVQWTGLHLVCEQLYALAAVLGMAKIQLPRDLWPALPGGVPYIVFDPEGRLDEQ